MLWEAKVCARLHARPLGAFVKPGKLCRASPCLTPHLSLCFALLHPPPPRYSCPSCVQGCCPGTAVPWPELGSHFPLLGHTDHCAVQVGPLPHCHWSWCGYVAGRLVDSLSSFAFAHSVLCPVVFHCFSSLSPPPFFFLSFPLSGRLIFDSSGGPVLRRAEPPLREVCHGCGPRPAISVQRVR